jgi:hypothetical protein
MRVKMLEDRPVTIDGVNTVDAEAGETYSMGEGVAASLIAAGAAEPVDPVLDPESEAAAEPQAENDEPELENKDQGAAEEAAQKKPPARGKRGKKA